MSPPQPLHIGIVGLGTAGMASALFLTRAGHRTVVHEAVEDPSPVGAGILLQPTGLSVLHRLGLARRLIERGHRVKRLHAHTPGGRTVMDLSYGLIDSDFFGLGMHRGTLFDELYKAVQVEGIEVQLGTRVDEVTRSGAKAEIRADGQTLGEYDLLIVANGARSGLRECPALPPSGESEYPWGALWFVGKAHSAMHGGTLYQVLDGTRRMVGMLPTGRAPGSDDELLTLYWSIRGDQVATFMERSLSEWQEEVVGLCPDARGLVAQVDRLDNLLFSEYHDVRMWPWHQGPVVVIGDAAHAMSPQLGQGCNTALLDAAALADCMAEHRSLDEALAAYSHIRKAPVGYYQWANRFITPFFQSDGRLLGWLRDTFMGFSCRLPVFRTMMVKTMMGVKRGIFRRSLPVEPLRKALPE